MSPSFSLSEIARSAQIKESSLRDFLERRGITSDLPNKKFSEELTQKILTLRKQSAHTRKDATQELKIDPEFQSLIPPLSDEERAQLEENILRDGIRDPLVIWKEQGILIDGHNRYDIAQKHGLHFRTVEKEFPNRDAVLVWIVQNQSGRRNLSTYARAELALKLKPVIAAQAKERQAEYHGNQYESALPKNSAEDQTPIDTRKKIAKAAGVSHDTIAKVEKLSAQASEEINAALRTGNISINAAFTAVAAGATTVEDVQNFKAQRKKNTTEKSNRTSTKDTEDDFQQSKQLIITSLQMLTDWLTETDDRKTVAKLANLLKKIFPQNGRKD